jgi:thiamine pyrophosphokinase
MLYALFQIILSGFNKLCSMRETDSMNKIECFIMAYQQLDGVIAVCETAGRLDQILGNLNTLYKAKDILGNIPVYQLARDSLSWLLRPGSHQIEVGEAVVKKHGWCSLIPLGAGVEHVTTTGLKWNLSKCIYIYLFHIQFFILCTHSR